MKLEPILTVTTEGLVVKLDKILQDLKSTEPATGAAGDPNTAKRRKGRIYKNKHDVKKKINQYLTDLVYFLETVAQSPELQAEFNNEIEELFGIGQSYKERRNPLFQRNMTSATELLINNTMFERLISAIVLPHDTMPDNLRMDLIYSLMLIISTKLMYSWPKSWKDIPQGHDVAAKIGYRSLSETTEWIRFAYELSQLNKPEKVESVSYGKVGFSPVYGKSYLEKFEGRGFM